MRGLIVESSAHIRSRILHILEQLDSVHSIYHTDSHSNADSLFDMVLPDFVLLDVDFQQNAAIELVKMIKQKSTGCVVIAMVNSEEERELNVFKLHGVDFILDKYHAFEKIPKTIAMADKLHKCKNLYTKHPFLATHELAYAI
ncbi:MAG: response regulator [Chitinophagaceae bacterium]